MEKEKLTMTLKLLANSNARSETARIRDVFEQIESALHAGVSRSMILDSLHEQGFKMTLRSFESAIYRLRKEKRTPIQHQSNHVMKIAGFNVSAPRFNPNQKTENDLLT